MAPGLRCVGVMTSGDFFAPDSLMGRGGRRGYIVQAGTYLIRLERHARSFATSARTSFVSYSISRIIYRTLVLEPLLPFPKNHLVTPN